VSDLTEIRKEKCRKTIESLEYCGDSFKGKFIKAKANVTGIDTSNIKKGDVVYVENGKVVTNVSHINKYECVANPIKIHDKALEYVKKMFRRVIWNMTHL